MLYLPRHFERGGIARSLFGRRQLHGPRRAPATAAVQTMCHRAPRAGTAWQAFGRCSLVQCRTAYVSGRRATSTFDIPAHSYSGLAIACIDVLVPRSKLVGRRHWCNVPNREAQEAGWPALSGQARGTVRRDGCSCRNQPGRTRPRPIHGAPSSRVSRWHF